MEIHTVFENAFYLLALLNPASKIMFLASYEPALTRSENRELSWKSSAAALTILILLAVAGNFIFSKVFRVEIYSLQITGGVIVFFIGLNAVQQGRFIQKETKGVRQDFTEVSLVPLAAPLIAGPGLIAATISLSAQHGLLASILSLSIAVAVNFGFMLFAQPINRILDRTHILGPLIRLTGLIISAIAIQMTLSGIRTYLQTLDLG